MATLRITSTNRGAAKRILNVWHDSQKVRTWSLAQLTDELQKTINEGLISSESVRRALARQTSAPQSLDKEQAGEASPNDHEGDNNPDPDSNPETEGVKDAPPDEDGAPDEQPEQDDSQAPESEQEKEPDWESQLDEQNDGNEPGTDNDEGESEAAGADSNKDSDEGDASEGDGNGESEGENESESGDPEQGDDSDSDNDDEADEGRGAEQEQDEDEDTSDERDADGNLFHEKLPLVMSFLKAGLNVSLVGPTGCGKSVMSAQIAKLLGRKFTTNGSVFSKYDIIGFIDGGGTYHATPLYESYVGGGLHCFDEKDRSSPDAVVTFNGMIDGQAQFAFPNGLQTRHKDFLAVSCMNTLGLGATADYTAQKQDASAESRFVYVEMGYDHNIEKRIGPQDIVKRVWAIREACAVLHIAHILPTRAIAQAAAARALGNVSRRDIDKCILFKALSTDAIKQIVTQMRKANRTHV